MAEILKGAPVAKEICSRVSAMVNTIKSKGLTPTLATVRVGERGDDIYYEKNAAKRMDSVGIDIIRLVLPESVTTQELCSVLSRLSEDKSVHGILLFKPLPSHIDDKKVLENLCPEKDVDGITEGSLAGIFTGSGRGFAPCTAEACVAILDYYGIELSGKKVCVVGRSLVVGKPVSQLLMSRNATVTVCHTKTENLMEETVRGDILISATGKIGLITDRYVKPGQIVIDVGTNTDAEGKLRGDVNFNLAEPVVAAITPVPGGVGSVTTSVLALHVAKAAERLV